MMGGRWRRTMATLVALAASGALAGGAGCAVPVVSCEAIASQLVGCDVQPQHLRCGAAVSDIDRALLARDLRDRGCDGLRNEDGTVRQEACAVFGWPCPEAVPAGFAARAPRAPMVFVGGIDGRPELDWNEDLLRRVEARIDSDVHHVGLAPWAPTAVRAVDLYHALDRLRGEGAGSRFHLVCYAVSGLDCRALVSPGGVFADDDAKRADAVAMVASITTIAAPHRGTNVAHVALLTNETVTERSLLTVLLGPRTRSPGLSGDEALIETLDGLTNEAALGQNERLVDDPEVRYQSFAGLSYPFGAASLPVELLVRRYCDGAVRPLVARESSLRDAMSEPLITTAPFASRTLSLAGQVVTSPSDGMVSVASAKWGRFRGCIPADHYDVIGQYGDAGPDPRTGFDAAAFYAALATDLAGEEE